MKKKWFYLFGSICVAISSVILSACLDSPCELFADEDKQYACYCEFDGGNGESYTHDFVKKKKFSNCEDLKKWLQKSEPDHEVECWTSKK